MNWIKPDWPVAEHIHAAVTLRSGGVSQGNYASLNPANHVNDLTEHVAINRRIIVEKLQLPSEPKWLQQVHGINVVKADEIHKQVQADASFTDQVGTVCVVLTADCLPVLFCGDQGDVIAATHAGWRGLHAGILAKTLDAMACRNVVVWLGPAIGPNQFEVGEDVYSAFVDADASTKKAFKLIKQNKWLADIYALARISLFNLDIEKIYGGGFCTVSDPHRFYSYRRDGAHTGRMASLIWRT